MKGIIMAGGNGSRLFPLTKSVSKHLLPIFNKPMIFYPISTLMLAGIREILLICSQDSLSSYKKLLRDGTQWGLKFEYLVQKHPGGVAEAFIIGEEFIADDDVCLILGDNFFYGHELQSYLLKAVGSNKPTIFAYQVKDPGRYGVLEFNSNREVISIEEKPVNPKSNLAVPGLYFYPNSVVYHAKSLTPSNRGELEITSINEIYMHDSNLHVIQFGRGISWFDVGTHDSLIDASIFVRTIENRQGLMICSPEEIAFRLSWLGRQQLIKLAGEYANDYGQYLMKVSRS